MGRPLSTGVSSLGSEILVENVEVALAFRMASDARLFEEIVRHLRANDVPSGEKGARANNFTKPGTTLPDHCTAGGV